MITSAGEVSGQLGLEPGSLLVKVYNATLRNIYRLLVLLSSRTIVFEEYLRQKLLRTIDRPDRL